MVLVNNYDFQLFSKGCFSICLQIYKKNKYNITIRQKKYKLTKKCILEIEKKGLEVERKGIEEASM